MSREVRGLLNCRESSEEQWHQSCRGDKSADNLHDLIKQQQRLGDSTMQSECLSLRVQQYQKMNDLHLDSSNFDTKKYFSTFLKNSTIKELIKKNNEVEEEIKVHDHEIQSLVFENYSKFIASIDTVRQMKTDISKVDSKLKHLDESMDKIAHLAERIDSTFSVKRKEIQKLDTINKDLKKLKTLCEFPDVLKADLQFYRSLEKNDSKLPYKQLFQSSVQCYKDCFTTLTDFKEEALVAPIYKESINKVEEVRSILWNLQNQLKARQSSEELKNITTKLIIMAEQQVSPMRTYFKKTKEKYSENCLANEKYFNSLESEFAQKEETLETLRAQYQAKIQKANEAGKTFLNEQFWKEFQLDFKFIFQEVYAIVRSPQEINELVVTSCKGIFTPILDNFCESVLKNCHSAAHFNLVTESALRYFNQLIGYITIDPLKKELSTLMRTSIEALCSNRVSLSFITLGKYFLQELTKHKTMVRQIHNSEDLQKDIYSHITPIKNYLLGNFLRLAMDFSTINYKEFYPSFKHFLDILSNLTRDFIKFVATILSTSSAHISQETVLLLIANLPKTVVSSTVKREIEDIAVKYRETQENGNTYLFAHTLLGMVQKNLASRILEDFYSSLKLSQDQKYTTNKELLVGIVDHIKKSLFRNLSNLCLYYIMEIDAIYQKTQIGDQLLFNQSSRKIEELLSICGLLFPDSRKIIQKKPSFLNTSEKSLRFDMDIMVAKKVRIFEKKELHTRSLLLSAFLRGVLKAILKLIRLRKFECQKFQAEIYCVVQLCYQISSVDDESLVNAFFYLIREQYYRGSEVPRIDKGVLDGIFSNERGKLNI